MRKGLVIFLLLVIVVLIAISPFLTGLWLQHRYRNLADLYNNTLKIDVLKYHRGWFHSNALLKVEVIQPDICKFWELTESNSGNPESLVFNVEQRIKHGPFIRRHKNGMPFYLGLAVVHNTLQLPPYFQKTFALMPTLTFDDLFTFTGWQIKHISLPTLAYHFDNNGTQVNLPQGVDTTLWIQRSGTQVKGHIDIPNMELNSSAQTYSLSTVAIGFDEKKSANGLWLGETSLTVPDLITKDDAEKAVVLSNVRYRLVTQESSNVLSGTHELTIQNLDLYGETMGPLHVLLTMNGFNAKALGDLITAVRKIFVTGELYESQMQQKISYMLPEIFNGSSHVDISDFHVTTPKGDLSISGKFNWPESSSTDSISNIIKTAKVQLSIRVTKSLANQAVHLAAQSPYFFNLTDDQRSKLLTEQHEIDVAMKRNFLVIMGMVLSQQLDETNAEQLVISQKENASLEAYANLLKSYFLKKQMTRYASYVLYLQYADVQRQIIDIQKEIDQLQELTEKQMREQLNLWVKDKYILQDKNNYIIEIVREQGSYMINGKKIPLGVR